MNASVHMKEIKKPKGSEETHTRQKDFINAQSRAVQNPMARREVLTNIIN